ncbi:uncharacterized protein wu:fi75a02 isoform X2 [Chiloscyllium plagiosum]|uniref:uncharacterized protein wu:fi75a02 isoform X2 n=1 Tax=Chiloscyllium plagiosum TaxID=36176 RepID=UPI001CB7B260|nr:uncharacterized protein wu:fi75a02 isoform X2 [Chiloscyllium plagiosum]
MLSALVGGGVSRGQQLSTPEAASLLLAQELCIGLRNRRVTRMSAQSRPSHQPQASHQAHRLGPRARQLPASASTPLLLLPDRRATRASSQGRPPHHVPEQHVRTHTLKSSGRMVRKLNYRKVANRGLLQTDAAATKRNARPRSKDPATEGHLEEHEAQEVEAVQRRRTGAVGKSQSVARRSKARSVVKPGSDQASCETHPRTRLSSATDIELRVKLPEAHIPSGEEVAALAVSPSGGDDVSSGARHERALMDRCGRRIPAPADVPPCVTKCRHLLCQTAQQPPSGDGPGRAPANQRGTENAATNDVHPENTSAEGPSHPTRPVKHTKVEKLDRGEGTGDAFRDNAVVTHAASSQTFPETVLVQGTPVEGFVNSDGPDQIPASVSVEGLVTIGMIVETRPGEAPSHNGTVLLPVGSEITSNVLVFQALEGGITSEHMTCINLRAAQHPEGPTAHSELTAAKVMASNGTIQGLMPGAPSGNTEMVETQAEREMTPDRPGREELTSRQLTVIQPATEGQAQEEAGAGLVIFQFPIERRVTDSRADATADPPMAADTGNSAPSRVTATKSSLPENDVPAETSAEMSAERGFPDGFSVEKAMASIMLRMNELVDVPTDITEDSGDDELTTDDELSSDSELTTEYELTSEDELPTSSQVVDETLMETELADIPADTSAAAVEVCTAVELAKEMGVAPSTLLPEKPLVNEPAEEAETAGDVTYELHFDGELVDIPTDIVIIDLTGENENEGIAFDFGLTKGTFAENGLVVISSDNTGPSRAVFSQDRLSENKLVKFSQEPLASLKDEGVRDLSAEGPVTAGGLAESALLKPPLGTADVETSAGDEVTTVLINAGSDPGVTLGGDMKGNQTPNETSVHNSFRNTEPLTPKRVAAIGNNTMSSKVNECQNIELRHSDSGSVPLPLGQTTHDPCREQEVNCVEKKSSQLITDGTTTFGKFGTVPVCEEAAPCAVKLKALRNTRRRPDFARLKVRESNRAVLLSNCAQNVPTLETSWEDRTLKCVDCGCSKCESVYMGHKLQHMEGVRLKNQPVLLMDDLGHGKQCRTLMLLEQLSAIANGLGVFSECVEMQQDFSDVIVALGMCSRFQFQKGIDRPFCLSSERVPHLDPFCRLSSPGSEQSASGKPLAQSHRKDPRWPFPPSMQFRCPDFPISPPVELASLLSCLTRGGEAGDHCCERTVAPQHSQTASQCHAGFGKTRRTPGLPFTTGRCPCARSRFGLHTVLALSSPTCYRLWTRQRHFGRAPDAHRPFLTQFGESLGKLTLPVGSDRPFWCLNCALGGVVSWWSQHCPTLRFSTSPSNNCGRSTPSDLQPLNFACIKEPYPTLPDPPTSTPGCTVTDSTFSSSAPLVPSITYVETQLHSEEKEERIPYDKSVSKSKGSLRKVSQIRIRKGVPKQDTNLTPMGLPKPKRLKKKEFSLEEIYTNQNYKSPSAHSKYLETIFEEPVLKKGSFVCTSLQKRKRLLEFQDYTLPRKRRAHAGVKILSRTRGRKATTRDGEIDSLLVQKLTELEAYLDEED